MFTDDEVCIVCFRLSHQSHQSLCLSGGRSEEAQAVGYHPRRDGHQQGRDPGERLPLGERRPLPPARPAQCHRDGPLHVPQR